MEETPSNEPEPAPLAIAATRAEGRRDALLFADFTSEGDVAAIQQKIADTERLLASGRPEMRPNMSPRTYREGFLAGLHEALAVVDEMKQRGEEEDIDLAFGRRRADAEGQVEAWLFATKSWRDRAAIEARIEAGPLAVPIPDSSFAPMAKIFSNYYTMSVVDTLKEALKVLKTLSSV